jgi:hypothetical protein
VLFLIVGVIIGADVDVDVFGFLGRNREQFRHRELKRRRG